MKFGFIPLGIMPTHEWYVIDEHGKILDKGGPCRIGMDIFDMGDEIPEYWVNICCRWYDSMEALCEDQLTEMFY